MTGTPRRDLIIGGGSFVCLAKILPPTLLANAAEAEGSADSRIISGSEAIVPVSVEAGEVIVDVSIDGRGPFPLIFDTGAENAVTPEIAAALGLKTEGTGTVRDSGGGSLSIAFTRVAQVRIGDAEMTDQRLAVLPLPRHVTDRGNRPAIAGFIGYELLTRFAVRLDYGHSILTLRPGRDFRYEGKGVRVPFTLAGNTAVVPGAADGIEGRFVVDTGSTGALTLRRAFVEDHGLDARHPSALRIKSIGPPGRLRLS
jgi:predicted aspartyl protease